MDDLNQTATRGDIEQLRSATKGRFDAYRDLVERMDNNHTRLMKAFREFDETNSKRIALAEGSQAAFRNWLGTLEDRMMAVEKRLNVPTQ